MDDLAEVKISFPLINRKTNPPFSSPRLVSIQNRLIRLITKDIFVYYLFIRRIINYKFPCFKFLIALIWVKLKKYIIGNGKCVPFKDAILSRLYRLTMAFSKRMD
jgi:hypothetical protein